MSDLSDDTKALRTSDGGLRFGVRGRFDEQELRSQPEDDGAVSVPHAASRQRFEAQR